MPPASERKTQHDHSLSLQDLREKVLQRTLLVLAIAMPAISVSNVVQTYLNDALTIGYVVRGFWSLVFVLLYFLHRRLGYKVSSTILIGMLVVTAALIASRGSVASGTLLISALALNLSALFFSRKGSLLTLAAMLICFGLAAYAIVSGIVVAPSAEQINLLSSNFWMRQFVIFLALGLALLVAQIYVIEYLVRLYTGYREQVVAEQQQRMALEVAERAREEEHELRLKAQNELAHSRRTEALSRMAGGIAHDFNNTLTVIVGNAELCLIHTESEAIRENLSYILDASTNASRLIQQLMTLGRRHLSEPKMVPMKSTLEKHLQAVKQVLPEDIIISLDMEQECSAWLDPMMLERAVYNLVLNARDAMPRGGEIKVRCYPARPNREDSNVSNEAVILSLSDSGAGMSDEVLEKIFDPFYSTKNEEGTGLGLSMVHAWLATIGGNIEVTSQSGIGSVFTLTLPGYTKQLHEKHVRTTTQPSTIRTGASIQVLVVEDRDDVRASMIQILQNHDYIVTGAASGDEALSIVNKMQSLSLVCLDCVMPGMPAIDVIHALRKIRPGLPILLCSGHSPEELIHRGVASGEFPFLAKPFTSAELLNKVQELTRTDNGH